MKERVLHTVKVVNERENIEVTYNLGERKNLFGCVWEATRVYKANNKGLCYKNRVEMTVVEVLNNDFYKVGDKISFGIK